MRRCDERFSETQDTALLESNRRGASLQRLILRANAAVVNGEGGAFIVESDGGLGIEGGDG